MRELLLCPPDYYGIEYEINPWMSRARGAEAPVAQEQWRGLQATLSKLNCKIELVPPQPKLPDMVFTANAGLAVSKQFIPSNFRHKERAVEAPHFGCNAVVIERDIVLPEGAPTLVAALSDRGYRCHQLPMTEFLKAGGACKCLTLFLPQREKI